jgi:5'-nucleotidase/UDP-sugar diphosphatase
MTFVTIYFLQQNYCVRLTLLTPLKKTNLFVRPKSYSLYMQKQFIAFIITLVCFVLASGDEKLTIFYWNDFHAQTMPFPANPQYLNSKKVGGEAYFASLLRQKRLGEAKSSNVLVLDAGDEFQGAPISVMTQGKSCFELLNLLAPDAMTLGNHEFDYGYESLLSLLKVLIVPVLAANLLETATLSFPLGVRPYLIKKFPHLTVGIIGLTLPELSKNTAAGASAKVTVMPIVPTVSRYIDTLRAQNAQCIIVVSHAGLTNDIELAKSVKGIDVIIGGHTHTPLFLPKKIGPTLICQAGGRGRYLGVLKMAVSASKRSIVSYQGALLEVTPKKTTADSVVGLLVNKQEKLVDSLLGDTIGTLATPLIRSRTDECNLGDFEADALKDGAKTDIALVNSGGLRTDLSAGPVRVRDIWEINPFSNEIVIVRLTGKQVVTFLTKQVDSPQELLQVSGLSYTYNSKEDSAKRLETVTVNGATIDTLRIYSIATNSYITDHFEGFFGIPKKEVELVMTGLLDRDVIIGYARKMRVIASEKGKRIIKK